MVSGQRTLKLEVRVYCVIILSSIPSNNNNTQTPARRRLQRMHLCVYYHIYKPHRCAYNAKKKKTLLRRVEHRDGPFAYNFISHVELKVCARRLFPSLKMNLFNNS